MPGWAGSDRRSRLPADWNARRRRVLKRDGHRCTHTDPDTGARCPNPATDVDHVVPGDDHSDENLTSLCGEHHRRKSGREGAAAARAKRRQIESRFKRAEAHPGLL